MSCCLSSLGGLGGSDLLAVLVVPDTGGRGAVAAADDGADAVRGEDGQYGSQDLRRRDLLIGARREALRLVSRWAGAVAKKRQPQMPQDSVS